MIVATKPTWNLLIFNEGGRYSHTSAFGSDGYGDVLLLAARKGWKLVAQEHWLTDEELDGMYGYRINPEALERGYLDPEQDIEICGEHHVDSLVERLNSIPGLDPKIELSELRERLFGVSYSQS